MFPCLSIILVTICKSPRTFPLIYGLLGSLTQIFQNQFPLLKVQRTYSKSLEDIIKTFLQARYISLASPSGVYKIFVKVQMFGSKLVCNSKSFEIDQQVLKSVGNVKKYLNEFNFPSWQQCNLRGYQVSGDATHALGGIQKMLGSKESLSLNRWQQGWSYLITSVYF